MAYTYTDFTIEIIKMELRDKALKDSTPKKYSRPMFEASEIIQQLQNKIKALEEGKV